MALSFLTVPRLFSLSVIILYHYNIFPFRGALREIPLKYKILLVKWFPFSEEYSLKEWEEKIFKGKVVYRIENGNSLSYVRATSKGTASALYYRIKLDSRRKRPVISWRWNVKEFPKKIFPWDGDQYWR